MRNIHVRANVLIHVRICLCVCVCVNLPKRDFYSEFTFCQCARV